jgi:hypothetical protein
MPLSLICRPYKAVYYRGVSDHPVVRLPARIPVIQDNRDTHTK